MSKQTAVEWLVKQLEQKIGKSISSVMADDIEQAKAMEREQIKDAWFDGRNPEGKMFFGDYYRREYGKEASNES